MDLTERMLARFNKNQKEYKMPSWAIQQTKRSSGLVEDICCHSIGHPNKEWLAEHDPDGKKGFALHGCDGCCKGD